MKREITCNNGSLYFNGLKISGRKNSSGKTMRGIAQYGLWCDVVLENGSTMRLTKEMLIEMYAGNNFNEAHNAFMNL